MTFPPMIYNFHIWIHFCGENKLKLANKNKKEYQFTHLIQKLPIIQSIYINLYITLHFILDKRKVRLYFHQLIIPLKFYINLTFYKPLNFRN